MNIPFNLQSTEFALEELGVTVRLWKGDYGKCRSLPLLINFIYFSPMSFVLYNSIGLSGGEIGLYNSNKSLPIKCIINNKQIINERIDASMTKSDIERIGLIGTDLRIYNKKNNELIASRSENASFWTTAFSLTNSEKPDELYTVNTFTFKDEKSANKFYNSLNKHSGGAKSYYHNHQESIKIHRNRNKVIIIWGYE